MSVSVTVNPLGSKTCRVCQSIPGSWEHVDHGFCTRLRNCQSIAIETDSCWYEHTHELVLPDSRVDWGWGGVNPGSSHGSHLVCD